MCINCILTHEDNQRDWLSMNLPVAQKTQTTSSVDGDTELVPSLCNCRGLRVLTRFGLRNIQAGTRGTVVFEEHDGVFIVRWDSGRLSIFERNEFSQLSCLGYTELDDVKPLGSRWN